MPVIMQNKMQQLLLLSLLLFSVNGYAKEYTMHNCDKDKPNLSDARSCHKSCKKTEIKVSYRTKGNTVMQIVKINGETQGQTIWKNCTVFDDENWNCDTREEPIFSEKASSEVQFFENNNMTNGKYIFQRGARIIDYKKSTDKTSTYTLYCAK